MSWNLGTTAAHTNVIPKLSSSNASSTGRNTEQIA